MTYESKHRGAHESFPQPDDGTVKVWRYLDLARLVTVLASRQLPFVRVDLFADPLEGSVTRPVQEARAANPVNAAMFARFRPELKRRVYASCWHSGNIESEAMWRIYCGARDGVALQTTYEKLDESLPSGEGIFLGKVSYVDYDQDDMVSPRNVLSPFMHKRPAFAHEQEVRSLIWLPSMLVAGGTELEELPTDEPPVVKVQWNATQTLESVYVNPYAEAWYRDAVEAVITAFAPELASRVRWSGMRVEPRY